MVRSKGIVIKLQLNNQDKQYLSRLLGIKRMIWNIALDYRIEIWNQYKKRNPCVDNFYEKKLINKLMSNNEIQKAFAKKELIKYEGLEFLVNLPNRCMQQSLNDLDLAFKNFFDPKMSNSYPSFKKKHDYNQSIRFLDSLGMKKHNSKHIQLKIGRLLYEGFNPERNNKKLFDKNTEILSVTIKKDNLDNFYASVSYSYEESDKKQLINSKKELGIDIGITDFLTTSNGESYDLSAKLKTIDRKRKNLQQRNSKKRKVGSRSWVKTKKQIAKLYKQQTNIRKDFHHKLSNTLTKTHGLIVREDLKIQNMSKSAKGTIEKPGKNVAQKSGLNREILNQGWGQFFTFLEYKSKERGVELIKVAPQGTSQICSKCEHKDPESRKGKFFKCTSCGFELDADINGAKNILTRGQRGIAERGSLTKLSPMTSELEISPLE